MKFEFTELQNLKIAVQEKIEYYGSALIQLEKDDYTNNCHYTLIKKEYKDHKDLYNKIINMLKNYDCTMKDLNHKK